MLVLASDTDPIYVRFQTSWRRYMRTNPHIDCYFYKGDPTITDDAELREDTLWIKIEDTLDTVYEKTLRAFTYFAGRLGDYDFVYRTNLSSFIDMDAYVRYYSTVPMKRFVSAFVGTYNDITFPSGAGFTMSSDVVADLVRDAPPKVKQDDVTIGNWLMSKDIAICPVGRVEYVHETSSNNVCASDIGLFHYRIKNPNRDVDIDIHNELYRKFYTLE